MKDIEKLESDLWNAADHLRANSKLTSSDYSCQLQNLAAASEHIRFLKQQNVKLRVARDLLLPRLMSGEIAV